MKLYSIPGHCSTAIHVSLHRCGIPFDVEVLAQGQPRPASFLALNPAGTVPLLVDDDLVLTQGVAILCHVDARFPAHRLFGTRGDLHQRAEAMRWLCFANTDLHGAFAPLFAPQLFLADPALHASLRASTIARLPGLFAAADARLASRAWLAGPRSCADDYLYVIATWARMFRIDLSGLVHLQAFMQRMQEDDAVLHVLQREARVPVEGAAA